MKKITKGLLIWTLSGRYWLFLYDQFSLTFFGTGQFLAEFFSFILICALLHGWCLESHGSFGGRYSNWNG